MIISRLWLKSESDSLWLDMNSPCRLSECEIDWIKMDIICTLSGSDQLAGLSAVNVLTES